MVRSGTPPADRLQWLLDAIPLAAFVFLVIMAGDRVRTARGIRSPTTIVTFDLLATCLAYYVAWSWSVGSLVSVIDESDLVSIAVSFTLSPTELWASILAIAEARDVSIGFPLPHVFNWLFWIVEAGLIFGGTWVSGRAMASDQPYCEKCKTWFAQLDGALWFEGTPEPSSLRTAFNESGKEPLDVLTALPSEPTQTGSEGDLGRFYRADLEYCPTCEAVCTIDVVEVVRTTDNDGEPQETTTSVVENLWVTPEHFARIRASSNPADGTTGSNASTVQPMSAASSGSAPAPALTAAQNQGFGSPLRANPKG